MVDVYEAIKGAFERPHETVNNNELLRELGKVVLPVKRGQLFLTVVSAAFGVPKAIDDAVEKSLLSGITDENVKRVLKVGGAFAVGLASQTTLGEMGELLNAFAVTPYIWKNVIDALAKK